VTADATQPLVRVADLRVRFPIRGGLLRRITNHVRAVDGVSFDISRGETLGLVGESGSGKTTLGRAVLRLLPDDAVVDGTVRFEADSILTLRPRPLRRVRRRMQMVFQDPYGSLNPRMRVADLVADPLEIYHLADGKEGRARRVEELFRLVGLDPRTRNRFPHAFSGGQRQRVAIARALAVDPQFLICDEPVTALDVSVQAQILNVLAELQKRLGLTYLFIAHDLSVVRHMSDRVGVMYLGKIVEIGLAKSVYERSAHPYTRSLLSAIPLSDPEAERARRRIILRGDIPSPVNPPPGCHFHTRCWLYQRLGKPERCRTEEPALRPAPHGTSVACHFAEELVAGSPAARAG
jgi:oligopeptide/dipeptide ABC transporter ATP-binding protein